MQYIRILLIFFFFLMTRPPPRSTLFPTRRSSDLRGRRGSEGVGLRSEAVDRSVTARLVFGRPSHPLDRKSTRLNSSHSQISYAVFCLKKKNILLNAR